MAQTAPAPAHSPSTAPAPAPSTATATSHSGVFEDRPIRHARAAAATASATTQHADSSTAASPDYGLARVGVALAIVLSLVFVMRWAGRRFLGDSAAAGRANQSVRVVSRTALAPRQQVLVLQVGQRLLIVGNTGTNLSALGEITDADEVAALLGQLRQPRDENPGRFASLFWRAARGYESPESGAGTAVAKSSAAPGPAADRELAEAQAGIDRADVRDLMEKVRSLSKQFHG